VVVVEHALTADHDDEVCTLPHGRSLLEFEPFSERTDMAKEPTTQVAFRLPDSLIARLDRHVERMTKEHPGLDFSRADAVRSLLTRALDEIEGASAPTKRGGR